MAQTDRTFVVAEEMAGQTLAGALRQLLLDVSWSQAKRLITTRRVEVSGVLCLNDARRLNAGESIVVHDQSRAPVPDSSAVRLLHIDPDLVVVDKPAGVITLRRDEEQHFTDERKQLQPSLDEMLQQMLPGGGAAKSRRAGGRNRKAKPKSPLHAVHRLDRDTSGLMLFALSPRGRDALIERFSRHEVKRVYIAVCLGRIEGPRTLESWIVRDRGDGLRGSIPKGTDNPDAQQAITHIKPIEHIGDDYTVLECRLETGRTHQIRIHLAEAGHMLCGEKLYLRPSPTAAAVADRSGAPRQALHSAELHFTHPITNKRMDFVSAAPRDMGGWLERLRSRM